MPALAQSSAQPRQATKAKSVKPVAAAPKALTLATNAKAAATPESATTVHAAGHVIVLSDGIVANATMAQIAPPAPGFVYER